MQKQSKTAKAASDTRLRAIFASLTPLSEAPKVEAQVMQGYSCGNCTSTFALNRITAGAAEGENAIEPLCPDCGSSEIMASAEPVEFDTLTEANAVAVSCHQCSTQHIFSSETQAGFQNALNCTVCGTTVAFSDEPEEEEATELNLDDDYSDDEIQDDEEDLDMDDIPDDEDDAFATTAEEQEDETGDSLVNAPSETVEATDTGDASRAEETTDNTELNNAPADTVEAADEDLDDLELVDALEGIEDDETAKVEASFVRIGDRVIAFLGDVSVGSIHKKDVLASRQEAFQSPGYLQALSNNYTVAGMSNTLRDFGFKRTSVKVSASRMAGLAEAKVQARAEAMVNGLQERMRQDTTAAMAVAAVGINKGFWSAEASANPLKQALLKELVQAGFRKPELLIDRAFATASDAYFKQVSTKAAELMDLEATVANGLSTAIASMRYNSGFVAVASDDEDDEDEDTEESSSITAGVRQGVRPAQSREAVASFGQASAPANGSGQGIHDLAIELRQKHGRLF